MNMNERQKLLLAAIPSSDSEPINWDALRAAGLAQLFLEMEKTAQEPEYHGEGSVMEHTRLVCEALVMEREYKEYSSEDKAVVFLAALLHDIGKIRCTLLDGGKISSPHHSAVGAVMARELLIRDFGFSGTSKLQSLRESILSLIRYHSFPPYAIKAENSELRLLKIASNGSLASRFSIRRLCLLGRADVLGRISADKDEYLERVEYCEMAASELSCLDGPHKFPSEFSQRAFFREKTKWLGQEMFKDSWGEVILMSGLPASGKDTWIKENCSDLPVISLDEIRERLHISPTDEQGAVIAEAHGRAREYLRKKQPFVWNATNITARMRAKQISLFEEYHASVRTVYLEASWEEQLRRNGEREAEVPARVMERMLSKLEPPERFESESVAWITT